jgi:hypothetical protein
MLAAVQRGERERGLSNIVDIIKGNIQEEGEAGKT